MAGRRLVGGGGWEGGFGRFSYYGFKQFLANGSRLASTALWHRRFCGIDGSVSLRIEIDFDGSSVSLRFSIGVAVLDWFDCFTCRILGRPLQKIGLFEQE